MHDLHKHVGTTFSQNLLSMKYKDPNLEEEFQKYYHPQILNMSKVYIWTSGLLTAMYIGMIIRGYIRNSINLERFQIFLPFLIFLEVYLIGSFYLSKRYFGVASRFASIHTLTSFITLFELNIMIGRKF
jgi:hypothetical protein